MIDQSGHTTELIRGRVHLDEMGQYVGQALNT